MINIPYVELRIYLMNYLNKVDINFTREELFKVEDLYINPIDLSNNYEYIDPKILGYFPNLKRLEIANSNIDANYIKNILPLRSLEDLKFDNCYISSLKDLSQVKITGLHLNNCIAPDLNSIEHYKHLIRISLTNMNLKAINYLETLPHITDVDLSFSKVDNISTMYHFILIEKLSIDNSNILDLDFVNKYSGLREISISNDQYAKNKALIDDLVSLGITVYEDGVICYNSLGGA